MHGDSGVDSACRSNRCVTRQTSLRDDASVNSDIAPPSVGFWGYSLPAAQSVGATLFKAAAGRYGPCYRGPFAAIEMRMSNTQMHDGVHGLNACNRQRGGICYHTALPHSNPNCRSADHKIIHST